MSWENLTLFFNKDCTGHRFIDFKFADFFTVSNYDSNRYYLLMPIWKMKCLIKGKKSIE